LKGTVNIFIVYPSLIELSIYRSIFILFFILLFYSYLYFMYSLYDIDINKQNKIINIKKKKKKINIYKKKKKKKKRGCSSSLNFILFYFSLYIYR